MKELTPLTQSYGYVVKMIDECNCHWAFYAVDLAITLFGTTFPEQSGMKKQLIDLRADKWHEMFTKLEA
jgi:hypothetical protein